MNARLHIRTACRNHKTVLAQAFHTTPFKIADITEDKRGKALHLMLMSSSPGVLDGDQYAFNIEVAENTCLHLHTQAYQRLYTMKGSASQRCAVHLEKGASFHFLPHPVVPHAASSFSAGNKIYLTEDNELLWGEVLTPGRKGSGEAFSYTSYHSRTEVLHQGKLVIKENLLLRPAVTAIHRTGMLEGYTHQAALLYWKEGGVTAGLINRLYQLDCSRVQIGISVLSEHALAVRLLGSGAEQLHHLLTIFAAHLSGGQP